MDEQKEYKLECVRKYLKIGFKNYSFFGETVLDALFVKHTEIETRSEELTDRFSLVLHDKFQAKSIIDGTLEGLPTILFRFCIDFDAPVTVDKLAEIVCGYYMSCASVMSVDELANVSCVKFIKELAEMRLCRDFVPFDCNEPGFRVSYLYRNNNSLNYLREYIHEILYCCGRGDDSDNSYQIKYTSKATGKRMTVALSLKDFNAYMRDVGDAGSAVRKYAVDLLECVNPEVGTYVDLQRVDSNSDEKTGDEETTDDVRPSAEVKTDEPKGYDLAFYVPYALNPSLLEGQVCYYLGQYRCSSFIRADETRSDRDDFYLVFPNVKEKYFLVSDLFYNGAYETGERLWRLILKTAKKWNFDKQCPEEMNV